MPQMVAFLRGINVGGHRVTGGELSEILAGIGMTESSTFRASGNLIFSTPEANEDATAHALEAGLEKALGYAVPVLLRTAAAVAAVAEQDPFAGADDGRGKHQVIFLPASATKASRKRAADLTGPDEILVFVGRELHWSPSAGVLDSDIDLDALEELLGPTTMRTMGTVRGIAAKLT